MNAIAYSRTVRKYSCIVREIRALFAHYSRISHHGAGGMLHAWVRYSVLNCNVFKTKLARWPIFATRERTQPRDGISKPFHRYSHMRGVLGHVTIGLSTACDAIDEQEAVPRRLRRRSATGCHRAVKTRARAPYACLAPTNNQRRLVLG